MKQLLLALILISSQTLLAAQRETLDDLESLALRVDEASLMVNVHYPNYRIGGGTPPTKQLVDCLILDILDSDNDITPELKLQLAGEIKLSQGFAFDSSTWTELTPEIKGSNVVFKMLPGNLYVTGLAVTPRSEDSLKKAIQKFMPATHAGNYPAAVNLLYVRGCRL